MRAGCADFDRLHYTESTSIPMSVSAFLDENFRHFNARETLEAARAYKRHIDEGGRMLVAVGGAMSTGEIGVSFAKMIRAGKVHAISCTAANLEEEIFNLIAHNEYRPAANYRDFTPDDELRLRDQGFNRIADTCIPESVMRRVEQQMLAYWREAAAQNASYLPYEYFYRLLADSDLAPLYQIPLEQCWVSAARDMQIPIYAPGFEDSTLGNMLTARIIQGDVPSHSVVRCGTQQMEHLVHWRLRLGPQASVGFFQIGGGIAGDFAICVVPLIVQDLRRQCRLWTYFAQISDATTSYGSYSGAAPNEKITWFKLEPEAPKFVINSDASLVAPLIFAYVLGE
jgi:deoxyhypusine synthase